MTEAEWLAASDPIPLLRYLPTGGRKPRLFACACCRRYGSLTPNAAQKIVELAEQYADKKYTGIRIADRDIHNALAVAHQFNTLTHSAADSITIAASNTLRLGGAIRASEWSLDAIVRIPNAMAIDAERKNQVFLLHDIFGNPFRPVSFDPNWRTSTVVSLAQSMYENRDFSTMPILSDALQDAGCENEDILNHCRGDGPHVRDCWIVDLVLGKE